MNKKEYKIPAATEVKLQQRLMQGMSSDADSRKFNGGVVNDDEEESTL